MLYLNSPAFVGGGREVITGQKGDLFFGNSWRGVGPSIHNLPFFQHPQYSKIDLLTNL
jgi:hypothetical protein